MLPRTSLWWITSAHDVVESDLGLQGGAEGVQRHRPGLIPDRAVGGNPSSRLKSLNRRQGVRSAVAIYGPRACEPGAGTVGQNGLKARDDGTGLPLAQLGHRGPVRKHRPGQGADDTVGGEASAALEFFDGSRESRDDLSLSTPLPLLTGVSPDCRHGSKRLHSARALNDPPLTPPSAAGLLSTESLDSPGTATRRSRRAPWKRARQQIAAKVHFTTMVF